jgi:hypothetical protein
VPDRVPKGPFTFCTAINCLDGRIQLPVISYLRERFGVEYVDVVTEAGPAGLLSGPADGARVQGIYECVTLSLERHQSRGLAVVAHHDCAGNPVPAATQQRQLRACLPLLRERFPAISVVALWVDEHWQVGELS